ncbi:MAG TPA: lipoyl synthase [Noviherbaspirillum sp.]|nr:lipoyl synthase [Noviherbaspirillum sp.]
MSESNQNPDKSALRSPVKTGEKLRGAEKMARIPIKIVPTEPSQYLRKPKWIRAEFTGTREVQRLKAILRENRLHTVCEEANCPNLGECFKSGTATFMIMGDICTRRCPFCDVGHGRPNPLDPAEPENMARTIREMGLKYVVITSVDRDDLRDGGAGHFVACIQETRRLNPGTKIEILTPDFRGRMDLALELLAQAPPDVFNHNLETVPRLYRQARPGADYAHSLDLLQQVKKRHPNVPTKSGLMLGLGETLEEVEEVMRDMREHGIEMLTLGQYLQPSAHHLPVQRYVTPQEFDALRDSGEKMGFSNVASGPMVRSSYHADMQAKDTVALRVKD